MEATKIQKEIDELVLAFKRGDLTTNEYSSMYYQLSQKLKNS